MMICTFSSSSLPHLHADMYAERVIHEPPRRTCGLKTEYTDELHSTASEGNFSERFPFMVSSYKVTLRMKT